MNKNLLILIGGIVVVAAVGGFLFLQGNSTGNKGSLNNIAENLQASLTGSGSMKCEFTDEGGQHTVTYIKDGKIRADFSGGEKEGSMIFKDKAMWSWEHATKQGVTMEFPEIDESDETPDVAFGTNSREGKKEIEEQVEKYKDSCKNEQISDDLFTPPTDVTFQNMSDFMNAVPQLPNQF